MHVLYMYMYVFVLGTAVSPHARSVASNGSGSSPVKAIDFLNFAGIKCFSYRTCNALQQLYLVPATKFTSLIWWMLRRGCALWMTVTLKPGKLSIYKHHVCYKAHRSHLRMWPLKSISLVSLIIDIERCFNYL